MKTTVSPALVKSWATRLIFQRRVQVAVLRNAGRTADAETVNQLYLELQNRLDQIYIEETEES